MMDKKGFQEAERSFLAYAATILAAAHRRATISLCPKNTRHLAATDR
jgi:hypothetical protein